VVDAYEFRPTDVVQGIRELLGVADSAARDLLENAVLLEMVDSSGRPRELASLMSEASVIERRELVRFYLERFDPYKTWKQRVRQGFDPLEAARYTKAIYGIDESAADVRDWFMGVGAYCGSVREDGVNVVPTEAGRPELGSLISGILNRGEAITAVLSSYLEVRTWEKLPEPVREHLSNALAKLINNDPPDEVVREAGLALDLFMSDLGENLTGGYTGLTMGQVAQKLKTDGLLVTKHGGLTAYAVQVRNAAEHPDTDADLGGDRWTITGKSAMSYVRVVLDTIRSSSAKIDGRFEL
jgi:hypothetical protein